MTSPVLKDVRILDFTWVLAGPYATRILADFGAEVIKVQPLLPPEEDDAFARGYYNTWNRNKLGITLDMSKPEGVELARKLDMPRLLLIVNEVPRPVDSTFLKEQIAQTYQCDVGAVLPHFEEVMALASAEVCVLRYPRHPLTTQLKQIGDELVKS